MTKLGKIMRGRRVVGFVNSALSYGEYYATIKDTDASVTFFTREALDRWLEDLGLTLR